MIRSVIGVACDSCLLLLFQEFISAVDSVFPYVTLVLTQHTWPPRIPTAVRGLSQRVALHLKAQSLPQQPEDVQSLTDMTDTYDLLVEGGAADDSVLQQLMSHRTGKTHLYLLPARF